MYNIKQFKEKHNDDKNRDITKITEEPKFVYNADDFYSEGYDKSDLHSDDSSASMTNTTVTISRKSSNSITYVPVLQKRDIKMAFLYAWYIMFVTFQKLDFSFLIILSIFCGFFIIFLNYYLFIIGGILLFSIIMNYIAIYFIRMEKRIFMIIYTTFLLLIFGYVGYFFSIMFTKNNFYINIENCFQQNEISIWNVTLLFIKSILVLEGMSHDSNFH